jgi:hypothetical protein
MSKTEDLLDAIGARLVTITGTGDSGVSLVDTLCMHPPVKPGQCSKTHVYLVRHGDRMDSAQTQLGERDHGPIVSIDILHGAEVGGERTTDPETVHRTTVRLLDEVLAVLDDFGWLDDVLGGSDSPDLLNLEALTGLNPLPKVKGVGAIYIDLTFDWPVRP